MLTDERLGLHLVVLLHCGNKFDGKSLVGHKNATARVSIRLAGRSQLRLAMFATYAP
jgi:hypothetical protein